MLAAGGPALKRWQAKKLVEKIEYHRYAGHLNEIVNDEYQTAENTNLIQDLKKYALKGETNFTIKQVGIPTLNKALEMIGLELEKRENQPINPHWELLNQHNREARKRKHYLQTQKAMNDNTQAYMMFLTLTSTPYHNEKAFGAGSKEWSKFIKAFKRECASAAGVERKNRDAWKGVTYIKTTEHGKKNDHGHIHAIIIAEEIPEKWKRDPNRGRPGNKREIAAVGNLWKWGWTSCQPIRFMGDVWKNKCQWVFPTEVKKKEKKTPEGRAVMYYGREREPLKTLEKCTRYLLKYSTKEEASEWKNKRKTKKLTRTITSQGLGKNLLEKLANLPANGREWSAKNWSVSLPSRKTLNLMNLQMKFKQNMVGMSDDWIMRRAERMQKRNELKRCKNCRTLKKDSITVQRYLSENSQQRERYFNTVKKLGDRYASEIAIPPPEDWMKQNNSHEYRTYM